MVIEIRGIRRDPALRARVAKQIQVALERLQLKPITAQATFFDDNGPKGGLAIRCALTARLPYRPAIRVERTAADQRTAFDGAFAVLERRLERYRERDRDSRRHPKKYFVARRLVESRPGARAEHSRKAG
ncbi:MAG TPA: HPF/RaiA family ribosome-associated protein [Methylomirabilota bacterium]|nr:HPF/RaiA family ribosome-associated protein [Methylomirabilota bacterium]